MLHILGIMLLTGGVVNTRFLYVDMAQPCQQRKQVTCPHIAMTVR